MSIELYNTLVGPLVGARPPRIGTAGDSMGGYDISSNTNGDANFELDGGAFAYALGCLYPCEVILDGRPAVVGAGNSGGNTSALGGSPASQLLNVSGSVPAQIDQWLAMSPLPDICEIQTSQNDSMGSVALAAANAVNITSFTTQLLAAGVGLVLISPRPPKHGEGSTGLPAAHEHFNRLLDQFCRDTPGAAFINYLPAVRDPGTTDELNGASARIEWRGGTAGTATSYSGDGTHGSALFGRAKAQLIVPYLKKLARPKVPRASSYLAWDETNFPLGSAFGSAGMMLGTGGTLAGSPNSGVAGTGTFSKCQITGAGSGITVTPTIITHADGYPRQRLALSGTATADVTIQLEVYTDAKMASKLRDFEALLDLNGLTGVAYWSLVGAGVFRFGSAQFLPSPVTESHFLYSTRPVPYASNNTTSTFLYLNIKSGTTVGGSVDIGRVGMWQH